MPKGRLAPTIGKPEPSVPDSGRTSVVRSRASALAGASRPPSGISSAVSSIARASPSFPNFLPGISRLHNGARGGMLALPAVAEPEPAPRTSPPADLLPVQREATLAYRLLRFILLPVFHVLFVFLVKGQQRVPREGPYVLIANHLNWLDSFLILVFFFKQKTAYELLA